MITKYKKYAVVLFALLLIGCGGEAVNEEQENLDAVENTEEIEVSGDPLVLTEEGGTANDTVSDDAIKAEEIQAKINSMTIEEKVAQLFIVTPESIVSGVSTVTAAGEATESAINDIPVGGFIYMSSNLENEEQVQTMLSNTNTYSMNRIGLPAFLSVDEEGGTVTRISGRGLFDVPDIPDMSELGANNDIEEVQMYGEIMGGYLSDLGFNLDYAPDADVLSNSENTVVKYRSFGSDPELVTELSAAIAEGLETNGVYATYKHFPGHGSTSGDTHDGYAYTEKTLEELMECELIPFQAAIDAECSFIMVGHISVPNVTGDDTPSSLSEVVVTEVLRETMGYDGIVITDAMNMGAITAQYTSAQAAVKAILAGVDIVLMPADFSSAYEGVIEAVNDGTISEERLDESLTRILEVKWEMM